MERTSLLERLSATSVNFGMGLAFGGLAMKQYSIMSNYSPSANYAEYPVYAGLGLMVSGFVSGLLSASTRTTNMGVYN